MGGPGGRDRMLAVKRRRKRPKIIFFVKKKFQQFFLNISSSCAKIFGRNKFSASGDSPKWVKSKRRKREEKRNK